MPIQRISLSVCVACTLACGTGCTVSQPHNSNMTQKVMTKKAFVEQPARRVAATGSHIRRSASPVRVIKRGNLVKTRGPTAQDVLTGGREPF